MNKLYVVLAVIAVAVGHAAASEITNSKCSARRESNTLSTVQYIDVEPCNGATGESTSPCVLTRSASSVANITIRFVPQQKHRRLKAMMVWDSGSVDLPFRGMAPNACSSLISGTCPTKPSEPMVWSALIPIRTSFPANTYPLKVKIMDGSKYVVCQSFSIKLV